MLAAVGSLALQSLGGWYIDYVIAEHEYDASGVFALVIGLLSWFLVAAHVVLIGAEVNVVIARRLWPRSLAGDLEPGGPPRIRAVRGGSAARPARAHRGQLRRRRLTEAHSMYPAARPPAFSSARAPLRGARVLSAG